MSSYLRSKAGPNSKNNSLAVRHWLRTAGASHLASIIRYPGCTRRAGPGGRDLDFRLPNATDSGPWHCNLPHLLGFSLLANSESIAPATALMWMSLVMNLSTELNFAASTGQERS